MLKEKRRNLAARQTNYKPSSARTKALANCLGRCYVVSSCGFVSIPDYRDNRQKTKVNNGIGTCYDNTFFSCPANHPSLAEDRADERLVVHVAVSTAEERLVRTPSTCREKGGRTARFARP